MRNVAVIIPAAGSGKRMQSDVPKPYLPLGGKTVLEWAIRKFVSVDRVSKIIVATRSDYVHTASEILRKVCNGNVLHHVVEGGAERQDSIRNAIAHVVDETVIAIHDAVRPFFSVKAFNDAIDACGQFDGAILAIPARDTIKIVQKSGLILNTPERESLWQAQTPQVFKSEVLKLAYQKAATDSFTGTDDASVVERYDGKVTVIPSDEKNIKLTFPVDFEIAEKLLSAYE